MFALNFYLAIKTFEDVYTRQNTIFSVTPPSSRKMIEQTQVQNVQSWKNISAMWHDRSSGYDELR